MQCYASLGVKNMSVVLFPVVAFTLAVVVGRIGTVMFRGTEQDAE